jgi:hypothetical protein
MINNKEIISHMDKFRSRYHNKFKSAEVFWEQFFIELNKKLEEKDGWTSEEMDKAAFNFYINNTYGIH